jgi:soluble lytic murein transglycosylase-like protein
VIDPNRRQARIQGLPYDGRVIVVGERPRNELAPLEPPNTGYMTYEDIFKEIALQYDLDWRILAEQAYWESRLDPYAIGASQEMGLMQIYPTTWQEWSQKLDVTDPFDPYSNALVGAAYLAFLRDYFKALGHSEAYWMLVAYNWGPDNLNKLLTGSGDWLQIPVRTRQYSLGILEAASSGTMRTGLFEQLQQQVMVDRGE